MKLRSLLLALALAVPVVSSAETCYLSFYSYIGTALDGREIQVPLEPSIGDDVVAYTTSTQSDAFPANTQLVRVICDVLAHFKVGTNPTATATNPYVAPDTPYYFAVSATGLKIAFYDGTSI